MSQSLALLGISVLSACAGRLDTRLPAPLLTPPPTQTTASVATASAAILTASSLSAVCVADLEPSRIGGTYVLTRPSTARERAAARWPSQPRNPVRVRIQSAFPLAGWNTSDREYVKAAFRHWESVGIPLNFSFVDDSAEADVVVHWIDRFSSNHDGWTTVWWDSHGWIQKGDVSLAIRKPNGKLLSPVSRKAVAIHEVGHVLGLAHSRDSTSIMSSTVYVGDITPLDTVAVRSLYAPPSPSRPSAAGAHERGVAALSGTPRSCVADTAGNS